MYEHELSKDIRELSALVNRGQLDISQRLATIESQMKSLLGNGQPGRITLIEEQVQSNTRFRYKIVGYAAAISAVVSGLWLVAWSFIPGFWKGR